MENDKETVENKNVEETGNVGTQANQNKDEGNAVKTFTQDEVNAKLGQTSNNSTTNTNIKKSNEEIAEEIIAGKWGNGEDRKNKVTNAGYNYNEVQNKVNELLGAKSSSNKKSNETIADEVIAGKWGNGTDRKNKLQSAGYDYNAIQAIVNKKLK